MDSCYDSRREMRVVVTSSIEGTYVPNVHLNCPHNEITAIAMRSLGPLPPEVFAPLGPDVTRIFKKIQRMARRYTEGKWDLSTTANSYSGALRRRYLRAEESLLLDGLSGPSDWRLKCFLKAEKVNPTVKFQKPRLIYPRTPRYNLELASRLKPFEHWVWGRLTSERVFSKGVGRCVLKGLNPRQRANLLVRKFKSLEDCVCFEADGKAWEAHVGPDGLKPEHDVYMAAFPRDRRLRYLLSKQLSLEGVLPCGAKFSRKGGRASGDYNTGMGNSLLMLAICAGVLNTFGIPFDLAVDGDNCLVFLRGVDASRVIAYFGSMVTQQSGQELVLEKPVRVVEEIRFGQSAPVFLGEGLGWTMVRDYRKVISGALSSHRWLREPLFAKEWCVGVLRCELSLSIGLPVLQAWVLACLRDMDFKGAVREHPHRDYQAIGAWFAREEESRDVSEACRVSFERAFGLTVPEQLLLEKGFGFNWSGRFEAFESPSSIESGPGVVDVFLDSRI